MLFFFIIFCPIFGFLSSILFGRILGKGAIYLSLVFSLLAFMFSCKTFYSVILFGDVNFIYFFDWFNIGLLNITWSFCIDSLTASMLVIVTFISFLVQLYSTEYMETDPHIIRFMSYLSLFTFFMLILITASNFLQMFVGWEGVGLSSYLLINFWFTRIQANKSAIKAMLINRVGDFFLLLAIFSIFFLFNSLDYAVVFSLVPLNLNHFFNVGFLSINAIDFISFCLFLGAMGKSAQIGLHTWLPDAMEGPTPVSALIHAATMVTAGVFLLIRCSYIIEHSSFVLNFIVIIGAMTCFFAATTGLFQNDMKKVIAYSTCSQLGYMIFACGLSGYDVAFFHLSNHAFFKALLFLGAGSIIHALGDEQDMRKMGGLKKILPFSYAAILIGSLALIGFPFLSGFYSKDIILELSYSKFTNFGHFAYILGTLAAFCTAFYSTRLILLVFLVNPNGNKNVILNSHESTLRITLPLFLLTICSIFIGYLTKDFFIGIGSNFWGASIFILPEHYTIVDLEFLETFFKILPLIMTLLGVISAFYLYIFKIFGFFFFKKTILFKKIYSFLNKKWFFDRIYNQFLTQSILFISYDFFYQKIDRGFLEFFGPNGIVLFIYNFNLYLKKFQTGNVFDYIEYFVGSIIFFFFVSLIFFPFFYVLIFMFILISFYIKNF